MRPRATASTGHSNLSLPIYCLHYISYLLPSQLKNTVLVLIINGLIPSVKNFRFFVQFDFRDLFLLQLIGKFKRKSSTIRHICKKKNWLSQLLFLFYFLSIILNSSERRRKIFACKKIGTEYYYLHSFIYLFIHYFYFNEAQCCRLKLHIIALI